MCTKTEKMQDKSAAWRFQRNRKNFQEAEMNKYDSDLKTQFSAYVKQSVLNAKGHYLKKKCRIECIETSYADGLIVPGQNTEDLLREIELLSGKIFNGITEIRILLEQIEDAQLFHAIITLTEEQKKVILLRIFYEKTFREIGRILEMSEKKAENTYYNALKKMRKLLRGDKYGI